MIEMTKLWKIIEPYLEKADTPTTKVRWVLMYTNF